MAPPPGNGRKGARNGQTILLIALLGAFLLSLSALSLDVIYAYVVKARLASSVDAAALAAARNLGDGPEAADRTVDLLFRANFPDGYLLAERIERLPPEISSPAPGVRQVRVTAEVDVPTFFLRIGGYDTLTLRSTASAARRDANIMLVVDRSASLHPTFADAWDDVQQATALFTGLFSDEIDRVGLVTFGSGAAVDVPLGPAFKAAIVDAIDVQVVPPSAATNSPYGLWLAYAELLAANDPAALNAIVFFTDGQPSAYTADFPVRTWHGGSPTTPYCGSSPREAVVATIQRGDAFRDILGFWETRARPSPIEVYYDRGGAKDYRTVSGCDNVVGSFGPDGDRVEQLFDPESCLPFDWNARYQPAEGAPLERWFSIQSGPYAVNQCSPALKSTVGSTQGERGLAVHHAAKNLTVNIAAAARRDLSLGRVYVYTIGLGGFGFPADDEFLRRIANDPLSPEFTDLEPEGAYVYAPTPAELQRAFEAVASEIFRLVR